MIKFYDVDKGYIKYLQCYDAQVPNIEYSSNSKFVCGVILNINNMDYYAPISHFNKKQQTNLPIYRNKKIISTIRFSFMFPALKSVLSIKSFTDIKNEDLQYAKLLETEYRYCKAHEQERRDKAKAVYEIGCNKKHKLNYTCCDFKLLENIYSQYQEQDVALTEVASTKVKD